MHVGPTVPRPHESLPASLRPLDCDLAQGYFFARPQPAEEVERLLSAQAACA